MPNFFTYAGFKLYFWSNEGNEPIHVHVTKGKPNSASTKFWVLENKKVILAKNKAELNAKEIKMLIRFIEANYDEIIEAWCHFFRIEKPKYYK